MTEFQRFGLLGFGTMGAGVAQVLAASGRDVIVVEIDTARLDAGTAAVAAFLDGGIARGKVTADQKETVLGRITGTTDVADLASVDAVLLPGTLHTAPPASDPDRVKAFMSDAMTTAFNISGHPALAVRTGFDHDGLPTNAQIVGRYFDEATVLRVAHTYERARKWHERRPPL